MLTESGPHRSRKHRRPVFLAVSVAVFIVAALLPARATPAVKSNDTGVASWRIYHNASGEYAFGYPDTLKPNIPTGTSCTNGRCTALEDVSVTGATVADGKMTVRNILFAIQRGINPRRLPVQRWYESLAHRLLNSSETVISIGGRFAIHRGPFARASSAIVINGKRVSRGEKVMPDNTTYVPLNKTDMLTISITDGPPEWVVLCNKVRSTLTFTK